MADLSELNSSQSVKIAGASSTGSETNFVNADSDGNLLVKAKQYPGIISTSNSSTTPLSANGVFTGSWEEVLDYGSVSIIVDTDKDSATDGISIELSSDGINVDVVHQYTRDASATPFGGAGMLPIKSRYFRFVYTNGNQAQSYFRLQTIFHIFPINPINLIATPITDSSPSVTSRSVITGKTAQGNYVNVKVTPSGSLTTAIGDINGVVGQTTMTNSLPVTIASDQSTIPVQEVLSIGGQNRNQAVTTSTAEALGAASILSARKVLTITPIDGTVYWGYSSGVTSSNGTPIFKNQTFVISASANVHIYLITASGTVNCRISEGA